MVATIFNNLSLGGKLGQNTVCCDGRDTSYGSLPVSLFIKFLFERNFGGNHGAYHNIKFVGYKRSRIVLTVERRWIKKKVVDVDRQDAALVVLILFFSGK